MRVLFFCISAALRRPIAFCNLEKSHRCGRHVILHFRLGWLALLSVASVWTIATKPRWLPSALQALHLFVAPNPWKYLSSPHGIIDLLTIIPSLIVVSGCLLLCKWKGSEGDLTFVVSDVVHDAIEPLPVLLCTPCAAYFSSSASAKTEAVFKVQEERVRL